MAEEKTDLLDDARVPMEVDSAPLVRQFISIEQVTKDTLINPNNVLDELLGLSSIFARYGLLVAKARIQRDGFKSRRNLLAAMLEKNIRDEAIEKEEKVTNPQVAARITGNSRMVEAELSLNEAAAVLAACTEARDAVKVKRDMLVQINKNQQTAYSASSPVIPNIPAPPAPDAASTAAPPPIPETTVVAGARTLEARGAEVIPADTLFGTPIDPVYETAESVAVKAALAVSELAAAPPDISDCM